MTSSKSNAYGTEMAVTCNGCGYSHDHFFHLNAADSRPLFQTRLIGRGWLVHKDRQYCQTCAARLMFNSRAPGVVGG